MSASFPERNSPPISPVPNESLVDRVRSAERKVREYLDDIGNRKLRWLPLHHPVKTKNLEKIAGDLQSILARLESGDRAAGERSRASLETLLDQLEHPEHIAFDTAWELADLLELEILQLTDDPHLFMRLTSTNEDPILGPRLRAHLPKPKLDDLLASYSENGKFKDNHFSLEARCALELLQQSLINEYRVDRAKARLRGIYLITMAVFLGVFLLGMCYFYLAASRPASDTSAGNATLLMLTLLSGAAGSVLSRAIQLGKQPLRAETDKPQAEPPLGIRTLLAGWKVFFAQPVIGATAAMILFLVVFARWINFGSDQLLQPASLALLGFVAGFSEPFFLGVLDKVAGKANASLH